MADSLQKGGGTKLDGEAENSVFTEILADAQRHMDAVKICATVEKFKDHIAGKGSQSGCGPLWLLDCPTSKQKVISEYLDLIKALVTKPAAKETEQFLLLVNVGPRLGTLSVTAAKLLELWPCTESIVVPLTAGPQQTLKTQYCLVLPIGKHPGSLPAFVKALRLRSAHPEALGFRCCDSACALRPNKLGEAGKDKVDINKEDQEVDLFCDDVACLAFCFGC